jgi:hypothetical protein
MVSVVDTTDGYFVFSLCDSSNNILSLARAVVAVPRNNQSYSTNLSCIYAPSSNTTVKFRCTDANSTGTVREYYSYFTITEII